MYNNPLYFGMISLERNPYLENQDLRIITHFIKNFINTIFTLMKIIACQFSPILE